MTRSCCYDFQYCNYHYHFFCFFFQFIKYFFQEFRPETNLAGINSRKLTPNSKKTVGERLHDSGNKSRVLRERRVLLADEDKMKKIASAQFTVKGLSKGMINTKSNLGE